MSLPLRKLLPISLTILCLAALVAITFVVGLSPQEAPTTQEEDVVSSFEVYDAPKVDQTPEPAPKEEERLVDVIEEAQEELPQEPPEDEEATKLRAQIEELRSGAKPDGQRTMLKPALLKVVTNFSKADVTVNGLNYKEYYGQDEQEGMVLPAGGPYQVVTDYEGKKKNYTMHFRPYENRYMIVELTGYAAPTTGAPAKPKPAVKKPTPPPKKPQAKKKDDAKNPGKITVYSKPRGTIIIDGKETGTSAPNTMEAEDGRHEVQVKYEDGSISEKKIVRVRKGSKIKLFFRQQKK